MQRFFVGIAIVLTLALLGGCGSVTPKRYDLAKFGMDDARNRLIEPLVKRMGPVYSERYRYVDYEVSPDGKFAVYRFDRKVATGPLFGYVIIHLTERPRVTTYAGEGNRHKLELDDMTYCSVPTTKPIKIVKNSLDISYYDPAAKPLMEYCLTNAHPETNAWFDNEADLKKIAELFVSAFPGVQYMAQ